MSGGGVHVQEEAGLLLVPHLCSNLSDRHHVLDQLLDQARGGASKSNSGSHFSPHSLNSACQQSEVSASCILYQGTCKYTIFQRRHSLISIPGKIQFPINLLSNKATKENFLRRYLIIRNLLFLSMMNVQSKAALYFSVCYYGKMINKVFQGDTTKGFE